MNLQATKVEDIRAYFQGFGKITDAKLKMLLWVLTSLFEARSTCLYKCAQENAFISDTKTEFKQRYGRLQNFFKTGLGEILIDGISVMILFLISNWLNTSCLELVMDRTNWDRGKRKYNFLSIGVLIQGVFVPIVSVDLGQKGNSNTKARLEVLDQFLKLWAHLKKPLPVLYLLADREFIGAEWLLALENRGFQFVIRVKNNLQFYPMIANQMGKKKFSVKIFQRWMRLCKQSMMEIVLENGYIVHLVIVENENKDQKGSEPYVFLITNLTEPRQAPAIYRRRYRIEPCYKHLKSNGFQLEQLNLNGQHKTDLMFSMLTLIYTMAVVQGIWKNEQQPVKQKVFKSKECPEISTFLDGFISLKEVIYNLKTFFEVFVSLLKGHFKFNYNT
jgi:hypothetical protein